jgi:nickel-dependent lactate racemase
VEIGTTGGTDFWECIQEVSSMAGLDMIINVVLNNDEQITQLYAGEAEAVQNECIKFFKSFNQIEFDEPADIVITTSNPKHHYWGQAAIAGYNAARVVKEGGTRIIISDCSEGFGDSQQEVIFYFDSLKQKWDDLEQYWEEKQGVEMDNSRNTCAVHRHLKLLQKSECIMVTTGFPASTPVLESQMVAETMESALTYAMKKHGRNANIIIYDMGAMVLPSIRE